MVKAKKTAKEKILRFPDNFLWGTSTSAHQVEGNNINNDWWQWEQQKGHVRNNEQSGRAADHYNRFEEDFDIAAGMNNNAHRFSIEWSRIEPEQGEWNMDEIEHYRQVLQALKQRGLKPMVTLQHFTLPEWLAKKGGWTSPDAAEAFKNYAAVITENLGNLIEIWVTINEPSIFVSQVYITANWPPQDKSKYRAFKAIRNLAKAHRLAYEVIHNEAKKNSRSVQVGIAKNALSIVTYGNKFKDYLYQRFSEFIWNDLFYFFTKKYHDFIGINYYFQQRVKRGDNGKVIFVDPRKEERRESSDLGWEIYPVGIFDVLLEFQKYKKPIYITENGLAAVNDDRRVRFIVAHLKEIYHAIEAGIDVRGYFHWSLLDNFEWSLGFAPRFGLVEVNYKTMERKPRNSSEIYGKICKTNGISFDLLRYVGWGDREERLISW